MRWPWQKNDLAEIARRERGKLAAEVVRNDRARHGLAQRAKETPVSDMLNDMFKQLNEVNRRG